ncbi:hypothetical protein K438DRAFT_1996877 [Mycena galopus ATCC 62051]|nr:hypothetical protein K438DRAFT_1996877 [Mycena galopus ATCC 62051]
MSSAKSMGFPEDPSDSSSSDTDSSSDHSNRNGRRTSSPRLSKRRRGHEHKGKMLLKLIPPSRYNGEPNANAIQRFARESRTYVMMGRVPDAQQVVVKDEEEWDLRRFFTELFEFCFPVDFRNTQRERLSDCYQNAKDVAAHVAEWSEIYNTIGLEDTQAKIVMLFNSLTYPIQTEIYRKNLDPEVATWDEIVKAATAAEVLVKLNQKNQKEAKFEYQSDESEHNEDDDADAPADDGSDAEEDYIEESSKREHGGRVEASQMLAEPMRTAAIGRDEQPLMLRQQADFMRRGLCFNCGGRGHRARDCPSPRLQPERNEFKRGINTHAMYFSTGSQSREALYESTEMYVGSVQLDVLLEVEEGGVEPMEFFKDSVEFLDSDTMINSEIPHLEGMPDLKEPESTWQTMQIELAFDIAEGATKSYEILEPESERYPESLRMKAPPMPVFNAHIILVGDVSDGKT